jgi:hypothetical protein
MIRMIRMIRMIWGRRTKTARTNLQRETVQNSRRFLVAALLGMPLFPLSFRTYVRNLQLGIRREVVTKAKRSLVASAPRNDRKGCSSECPFSRFHSESRLRRGEESAVEECLRHG